MIVQEEVPHTLEEFKALGKTIEEYRNKVNNAKKIWHSGDEKPEIYKDEIFGHSLNTFCLCAIWYDGWIIEYCKVMDNGNFLCIKNGKEYEHNFFDFWCYVYDLEPLSADFLINIGVEDYEQ